nr:c7-1.1 [Tranosema rostrale ichnovirus]
MHSQEYEISLLPSAPSSKRRHIFLPLDIIFYMGKFLNFEDYRSFIRSLRPDGAESDIFRAKLWELSTHNMEAIFLNGKRLEIQYNFDPERLERDLVLINLDYLLPVFGGVMPPAMERFSSIYELYNFIEMNVHLNKCSNHRHACCPCHLFHDGEEFDKTFVKPAADNCEDGHFHHYCWEHVISWLGNYLEPAILLQESKQLFNEKIAEQYALFPNEIVYFQTGKRATPEFLLKSALEIDVAIYESDGE